MLTVGQRVKDRRRGHVVAAIGIGGQRLEQDQSGGFATATHRTNKGQAGRDQVAAKDMAVQRPQCHRHALLGNEREV